MQRSKVEVYLHFAWATWHRESLINSTIERPLYRCIEMEAMRMGCKILAIGGIPDHIHLVMKIPSTCAISQLMKHIKGVSSTFARDLTGNQNYFGWQDNYGVLSISYRNLNKIIQYVQQQKQHHQTGELWPEAEEFFEMVEEKKEG